jgi:hypothetical protein
MNYNVSISNIVNQLTLNESNWKNENWKQAWPLIDQEVLNEAFGKHALIQTLFHDLGEIIPRKCKSLARVEKKMSEQPAGRENYFKVVCDFIAVRVHCNLEEMQSKIDSLRDIVFANEGHLYVRGSSLERPYGFFKDSKGNYTDITQYVYVFLKNVGSPIEFQIGHEFASHTFSIDSALRDDPNCGKIDLWKNNFYNDVKDYLLNKANTRQPAPKSTLQAKAEQMHDGNVPQDLQNILNII